MNKYFRCTNSENPMSDWGHAMFSDNYEKISHYGENVFTFDSSKAVDIQDLEEGIRNAWQECQEEEDFGQMTDAYYMSLNAEQIIEAFNPTDIVDSAEGYDCDLVVWVWEKVLEPKDIYAVITNDGAVVFDRELIRKLDENEVNNI